MKGKHLNLAQRAFKGKDTYRVYKEVHISRRGVLFQNYLKLNSNLLSEKMNKLKLI